MHDSEWKKCVEMVVIKISRYFGLLHSSKTKLHSNLRQRSRFVQSNVIPWGKIITAEISDNWMYIVSSINKQQRVITLKMIPCIVVEL